MNIFVTDPCPVKCAAFLDSKRVIKMILESSQLLSSVIELNGGKGFYRLTHKNHPSTIWTSKSRSNALWLLEHLKALCGEYTKRYGKIHKCESYLPYIQENIKLIPDVGLLSFPNLTTFKDVSDVHLAYRLYLQEKWNNDKVKPKW